MDSGSKYGGIAQVITNFEIGRRIVEHEQKGKIRAQYGKQLLADISKHLTAEFGIGFSERNLRNMRKFYLVYQGRSGEIWQMASAKLVDKQKCQTVSGKLQKTQMPSAQLFKPITTSRKFMLSWSQYVFLIGIRDEDVRSFYEIEASNNGWTLPELTRQFNSSLYERLALSRNKKEVKQLSQRGQIIEKPNDVLKNPYVARIRVRACILLFSV